MKYDIVKEISGFLGCETPDSWIDLARNRIPDLLVDHAQCEKKAASSAMQLMFRYPEDEEMAGKMSKLAREELRHFEQVLKIMQGKGIADRKQTAARYASGLKEHIRKSEPARLVDSLIIGAFIEARSCERFARLVPYLDSELGQFYSGLLESEGRHYRSYLDLARRRWLQSRHDRSKSAAPGAVHLEEADADSKKLIEFEERVDFFRSIEQSLIESPDGQFRFHSGVPQ